MATLVIACPICLQKIRAPDAVIGRQIKCPQCKNPFTAADPGAPAAGALAANPPAIPEPEEAAGVDPLGLEGDEPAAPPARAGIMDYLLFRRMVTPAILTALFYFGVAVILLFGLVYAITAVVGMASQATGVALGLLSMLLDFVLTISAVVLWRVFCEVVITLFRILEQLREMNGKL